MSDYEKEVRRQARRLPRIQRETIKEILRLLEEAHAAVLVAMAGASPEASARLGKQRAAITASIARFRARAEGRAVEGMNAAWVAGIEMGTGPAAAIGIQLGPQLAINDRALLAMREFLTDRIKDISVKTVDALNEVLGQVVIGVKPMATALTDVQRILGGATRRRAMNIVFTEIGRAYSAATYESLMAMHRSGIKVGKRWMKSGKLKPRPAHVHAHNQLVRVDEPFVIADRVNGGFEKLRYPRDPKASPGNTINCGCQMVPVVDGSTFGASVIDIPDDPKAAIRKVPRTQRDAENKAVVERVNDRLARFLAIPPAAVGLAVVSSANAKPLVDVERDGELSAQLGLWWRGSSKPTTAGPLASELTRHLGTRDSTVRVSAYTNKKQRVKHKDVTPADYVNAVEWYGGRYLVAVSDRSDIVLVAKDEGAYWWIVLRARGKGSERAVYFTSLHRIKPKDLRKKQAEGGAVINGSWDAVWK